MPNVRDLIAAPRHHVHAQLRVVLALLPVARDLPHRAVRPQPRRAGQQAARSAATRSSTRATTSRSGSSAPGIARSTSASSSTATGVTRRHGGAARLERVVRLGRPLDLPLLGLHAQRERVLNTYGVGRNPIFYSTDSTRSAPWISSHGTRPASSPSSSRSPSSPPTPARPREPDDPRGIGTPAVGAAPPRPLRGNPAAAAARLQRGGRVRQAGLHPRPAADRPRPRRADPGELPAAARVAARRGRGGRPHPRRAPDRGRARRHARDLHLGQRLLPRRAPRPERQGAPLRALDPPAAASCAARASRRTRTAASSSRTPTSPRRSWTPPAPGRAGPRTGARCSSSYATRGANGAGTC